MKRSTLPSGTPRMRSALVKTARWSPMSRRMGLSATYRPSTGGESAASVVGPERSPIHSPTVTALPGEFAPPTRLLLGPGPSMVHPRVLAAMAQPLLGHLDPAFVMMMEDVKALLRIVFQTTNALTFPISGTGSAGMEACIVNLVEPGDEVVVGVNG